MKYFRLLLATSGFALLAWLAQAEIIPAARLVSWVPGVTVGVPGGIPTRPSGSGIIRDVTLAPYNADKTGATDAGPAIQAAINAAKANDVVYLPAGTYLVATRIFINYKNNFITVRGDGPGLTNLDCRTSTVPSM